jgi:hypothetical protein
MLYKGKIFETQISSQELAVIKELEGKCSVTINPKATTLLSVELFSHGSTAPSGPKPPLRSSRSHSDTPHSVGLLWKRDRPVAKACTWQRTTLSKDRHQCPLRDSSPQSQQASSRRRMPQTARPPGSALLYLLMINYLSNTSVTMNIAKILCSFHLLFLIFIF